MLPVWRGCVQCNFTLHDLSAVYCDMTHEGS